MLNVDYLFKVYIEKLYNYLGCKLYIKIDAFYFRYKASRIY